MAAVQPLDHLSRVLVSLPGKNLALATSVGIPDDARAAAQHSRYVEALKQCGIEVTVVTPEAAFPNDCFVGNMAVVTEYLAVISNFADNDPRQGCQKSVASALAGDKFLKFITAPGLLDADDVLRIRNHFYIGLSDSTNQEGAAQLAFFLKEFGYEVTMLEQSSGNSLRLNTAAVWLGGNHLLIREELARNFAFLGFDKIVVPHEERGATNALMVNGTLLLPAGYAATAAAIREAGISVVEINVSEFEKIGGGLKSLSLCLPKNAKSEPIVLPALSAHKSAA